MQSSNAPSAVAQRPRCLSIFRYICPFHVYSPGTSRLQPFSSLQASFIDYAGGMDVKKRSIWDPESNHLHNHLLSAQERIADELASPQGNGGVSHGVGA